MHVGGRIRKSNAKPLCGVAGIVTNQIGLDERKPDACRNYGDYDPHDQDGPDTSPSSI